MSSLRLHPSTANQPPLNLAEEVARAEALLAERSAELATLREEFHQFKVRYTQVVGSRLAELAEVEREIREAERRLLGGDEESESEAEKADDAAQTPTIRAAPAGKGLRQLFWSVARLFHPDHAADESEARRRHSVMAEASRAYREGDVESLHALLGDEDLQLYCATAHNHDAADEDLSTKLARLKEELLTIEFGLKRIRQDALYRLKLKADEEARCQRDALAQMAASIARQITKARRRLAHLS
jgi:hypothetical protein